MWAQVRLVPGSLFVLCCVWRI